MPEQTLISALAEIVDELMSGPCEDADTEAVRKAVNNAAQLGANVGRDEERKRTRVLLKAQFFDG